jgi:putative transcriptional regulator
MTKTSIELGDLLIAEPFTFESEFKRSLVMVVDHSLKEGTVGFVLNKKLEIRVDTLIKGFPEFQDFAYFGGPVATDTLHFIHTKGDLIEDSIPIFDNLFWSGNFEQIKFLIKSGVLKPGEIRFYVGYTGWSSGQLAEELEWGSWIKDKGDANLVFNSGSDDLWKMVLENKGSTYSVLAQFPKVMNWN